MNRSAHQRNVEVMQNAMDHSHRPGKDIEDDTRRERDCLYSIFCSLAGELSTKGLKRHIEFQQATQARIDARVEEMKAASLAHFAANPCTNSLCQILHRHVGTCQFYEADL